MMEPTKQCPWGKCESCGRSGGARDDLTLFNWATARECRECVLTTLAYKMKKEDSIATLEDCRHWLNEWMHGRNLANINEYKCADHIRSFLEATTP